MIADAAACHFLDALPFDLSRPGAQDLYGILGAIYWKSATVVTLLRKAGIPPSAVNLDQSMDAALVEVLVTARARNRLRLLLEQVLTDPEAEAYRTRLRELVDASPAVEVLVPMEGGQNGAPSEAPIERRPAVLDVAFLAGGLRVAPAVARILAWHGADRRVVGTAFRIGERHLLTNHHVLFEGLAPARRVEIWFNYEVDLEGQESVHDVHEGISSSIVGDRGDDWAVIETAETLPAAYPILGLSPSAPVAVDERVSIIQHPRGGPKRVGLHRNEVCQVNEKLVQYRTDTEGGSSGAPIFNRRWEVVALHHSRAMATGGAPGRFVNEGIRIERIARGIAERGVRH